MMVNTKVCHTVSYLVPSQWNVDVRISLTLVALLLNIFIISIFLRRQNRTPVTILLSFLAITDSLTSLFAVIPNFSGQYLFYDELRCVKNQGRFQDFKLGGGAHFKKIAPSGGRRKIVCGISCEKSRFYAKKSYFFQF